MLLPTGEGGHGRGQLRGYGRLGGPTTGGQTGRSALLLTQHPQVRGGELRPRFDAELLGQPVPHGQVDLQRGGLLARSGQRQHQAGVQPLVQRLVRTHRAQRDQRLVGPAGVQRHVGVGEGGGQPALAQRDHGRMLAHPGPAVGQHRAAPQPQRLAEQRLGLVHVAGPLRRAGPPDQVVEGRHVELVHAQLQPVAAGGERDRLRRRPAGPLRLEQGPQLPHVHVDEAPAGARRMVTPEHVDDLVLADDPVRLDREQTEQGPPGRRDLDLDAARVRRERAQRGHPEPGRGRRTRSRGQRGQQLGLVRVGQPQRPGEAVHGLGPGSAHPVLLQVPQRPHAQPGPVGELLLTQAEPDPVAAEQLTQGHRSLDAVVSAGFR